MMCPHLDLTSVRLTRWVETPCLRLVANPGICFQLSASKESDNTRCDDLCPRQVYLCTQKKKKYLFHDADKSVPHNTGNVFCPKQPVFLFQQADRKSGLQRTHTQSFTKNAGVTNH